MFLNKWHKLDWEENIANIKIAEEDRDDTEEDLDDMIDIADDGNVRWSRHGSNWRLGHQASSMSKLLKRKLDNSQPVKTKLLPFFTKLKNCTIWLVSDIFY